MWAIIASILCYGGTAAAGWMISDWFNEKNTTAQVEAASGSEFSLLAFLSKHWVKWLVTLVVVGVVGLLTMRFIKKTK